MYKGKTKKHRMARLHEAVVNARGRGLPGRLAEIGALCVAISAGIWAAQHGRTVIGSAVAMFVLYSLILQVVSRLVFLIISLLSLPAYKIYEKHTQYRGRYYERASKDCGRKSNYQRYQKKSYHEYHSGFEQTSNYDQGRQYEQYQKYEKDTDSGREDYNASQNTSNMSEDAARVLFGLGETFTLEELKIARNNEMKRCHPDQNMNKNHTDEERAKKVNQAYATLKNLVQKKQTA